jgi:hypothetical protein
VDVHVTRCTLSLLLFKSPSHQNEDMLLLVEHMGKRDMYTNFNEEQYREIATWKSKEVEV